MRIKTVLFDLDGTLVDSLSVIRSTYQHVFGEMGIPWKDGEVMRYIGISLREIAKHYAGERAVEFITMYQREYKRVHARGSRVFPGTSELLLNLEEQGYQTGIVTSKGRLGACLSITQLDLEPRFDVLVTADDVPRAKPDPGPVLLACRALNSLPSATVFVGDSPYDIAAGRSAGVRMLAVTWGLLSSEAVNGYDVDGVLHSWDDLGQYL